MGAPPRHRCRVRGHRQRDLPDRRPARGPVPAGAGGRRRDPALAARPRRTRPASWSAVPGSRPPSRSPSADPGAATRCPWSVQTWLPGTAATDDDPGGVRAFAHDLAEFIPDVRAIDTGGSDVRRLRPRRRPARPRRLAGDLLPAQRAAARRTAAAPRCGRRCASCRGPAADVMTHGDLVPGNVLVSRGRLAGVLDVGGLARPTRPSTSSRAWHLLERRPAAGAARPPRVRRPRAGNAAGRGRSRRRWALVWYYVDSNPVMSTMGRRTLDRILAAP